MLEEAAEKLFRGDGQRALSAAMGIVLPTKADRFVRHPEQTVVGDGDPMRVASEIVENMLGSAERGLGVDHPILSEQGSQEGCKVVGFLQRPTRAAEDEMVVAKGASQSRHEFTAEDTAEDFHGQEETGARSDPARMVGR